MPSITRWLKAVLAAIFLGLTSPAAAQTVERLSVGKAAIDVVFPSPPQEPLRTITLDWIGSAARAVATYYGRFPISQLVIRVSIHYGSGVYGGQMMDRDSGLITIGVGQYSTAEDLARDWIMTHEMVHLAFPSVFQRHNWMEEGLATYVEPIARARAGELSAETVWGDMVAGMPQGLPEAGDSGLDFTPTWGRTYWGGALFCLLADVEIRKRTGNKLGLEHALRAIMQERRAAGRDLAGAFAIGDRAVGVPVLQELYEKMKDKPAPVDLARLWKELGVRYRAGVCTFDDSALLAPIRKAITQSVHLSEVATVAQES